VKPSFRRAQRIVLAPAALPLTVLVLFAPGVGKIAEIP
jgi:hypothetical protein